MTGPLTDRIQHVGMVYFNVPFEFTLLKFQLSLEKQLRIILILFSLKCVGSVFQLIKEANTLILDCLKKLRSTKDN